MTEVDRDYRLSEGTRLRGGVVTFDPRLDRVPYYDKRSKEYPIRELIDVTLPRRDRTWTVPFTLDQGSEGACTGFSVMTEAIAGPIVVRFDNAENAGRLARQVYYRAREIDEWPGENYEGSSVLAATKAAIEIASVYREYRWALGPGAEAAENDLAATICQWGPSVLGTWWRSGMFEPDADGFLRYEGSYVGGHAYVVTRYSVARDAYYTPNTWGGAGAGWIRRADMVRALAEDGEAMIPVRRRRLDPAG